MKRETLQRNFPPSNSKKDCNVTYIVIQYSWQGRQDPITSWSKWQQLIITTYLKLRDPKLVQPRKEGNRSELARFKMLYKEKRKAQSRSRPCKSDKLQIYRNKTPGYHSLTKFSIASDALEPSTIKNEFKWKIETSSGWRNMRISVESYDTAHKIY